MERIGVVNAAMFTRGLVTGLQCERLVDKSTPKESRGRDSVLYYGRRYESHARRGVAHLSARIPQEEKVPRPRPISAASGWKPRTTDRDRSK